MIAPSLIIQHLRANCPIFNGRVAGALVMNSFLMADDFAVPYAFVVPLHDQGESQIEMSPLSIGLPARFGVVVAVENKSDEPGFSAAEKFIEIRQVLLTALLGFVPGADYAPVLYEGMPEAPDMNRARAWCQFDFSSLHWTTGAPANEEMP